jgi:AcrR family transcriptional regulator
VAENRRGRPIKVDPERVALVAVRLFEERGFDTVTMDDIAQAAQVSRRTLFRLFSTKSALVWDGLTEAMDAFGQALADAPDGDDAITAVRHAVVRGLVFPSPIVEITRTRLRLIAGHPALYAESVPRVREAGRQMADFIARRLGLDPDDLFVAVATATINATAFAALTWWAEHGSGPPQAVLDRALRDIEQGLASAAGRRDSTEPAASG